VATGDGSRNMVEWLAARLDVEASTARTLLMLARADDEEVETGLSAGEVTTDRAAAVSRLKAAGADADTIARSWGFDLAGVRYLTGRHRPVTPGDEAAGHASRYLHIQPSLDEHSWRLWGQLAGVDGRLVEKAIATETDRLPNNPDTTAGQDRADALVSVCAGWLAGDDAGSDLTAEIFIDAALAAASDGQQGASIVTGPRVGPNTLAEILCAGTISVTVSDQSTRTVCTTPTTRTIPPAIRRHVLQRDGHACVIDGCGSRNRLQPHHLIRYSDGGTHHPDNLVSLCWYHHHVVVHQMRRRIDPASPAQRRRFLPRTTRAP